MSSFTAHACVSKSINRYGRIGSGCLGGDNITDRRTDKRTETRFKNFDIVITRMKNYLHLTFFIRWEFLSSFLFVHFYFGIKIIKLRNSIVLSYRCFSMCLTTGIRCRVCKKLNFFTAKRRSLKNSY